MDVFGISEVSLALLGNAMCLRTLLKFFEAANVSKMHWGWLERCEGEQGNGSSFSHSFHHVLLPQYMKVCTHAQPVEILKKLKNLEHLHLQDLGICSLMVVGRLLRGM